MAYAITADDLAFHYSARLREYGIDYKGGGSFQEIEYCPWCGKKLPPPLTEEWYDRVRELGFENPWLVEDDDLPEELRTDRWWKQAGL
ncbi:hypothetical protein TH66_12245 [Carbonactinospora thermoautotrophica]|nr:hypothetical protein TH66_12245 [Carbonactinospora thermoautotrophica]KWX07565.1 hypothetical protein TR74_18405 [Carbonactinospora thermoautotrophica]